MNFIVSSIKGVNFSDFSCNTAVSHDYFNPVVNLSHVINFHPSVNQYQHQCSNNKVENRFKYTIRFNLTDNNILDWQYDDRSEMEREFERISSIVLGAYTD